MSALINGSRADLVRQLRSDEQFMQIFHSISATDRRTVFAEPESFSDTKTDGMLDMIYGLCAPSELRTELERQVLLEISVRRNQASRSDDHLRTDLGSEKVIQMDRKLLREFRTYNQRLSLSIWHCSQQGCFATLAADPAESMAFDKIIRIYQLAGSHHEAIGDCSSLIQTRRRGVGGSSIVGAFASKSEREGNNGGTDREIALRRLGEYCLDSLPFLRGKAESSTGVPKLKNKLCVHAISCLFDVSYNFIYRTKIAPAQSGVTAGEVIESLIDTAGVRMRAQRRTGKRTGFPRIADLPSYDCGCTTPCLADAPLELLQKWYNEFKKCAQQLHSRRKEKQYTT